MKTYKPVTPSLRHRRITDRTHLSKEKSLKGLTFGFGKSGFRNQFGRVTIRHRGGGHKYNSRILYNNILPNIGQYIVERLEYDPQRNARIALLKSLSPLPSLLKPSSDSVIINNHKLFYVLAELS
jgi:ribosomal protein L2